MGLSEPLILLIETAMILYTERLRIAPLDVEQFGLLLKDITLTEHLLGLNLSGEVFDKETREAMEWLYSEAIKDPANYIWYTDWLIILKQENKIIGSACFKGKPDKEGSVEIGYGMNEVYRNKGYISEAVKTITDWALRQPGVNIIFAETDKSNIASQHVLEKCRFKRYNETEIS